MTKLAPLVGLALFALSACAPIGAATREPAPVPSGRAAATPSAAQTPTAETDDLAAYRRTAQVLANKDIAQVTTIDFAHFRRGSMLRSHASDPAAQGELRAALKSGNPAAIQKAADAVLAEDAAHVVAHVVLMNLDQDAGHTADAKLHDAFIAGIFRSILASGDGRSFTTAIRVYFVREEYDLMRVIGAQVLMQSLHRQDGRSFDVLRIKDKKGQERDFYFDITELLAEEGKRFGLPASSS
jgi:hypothetical protein